MNDRVRTWARDGIHSPTPETDFDGPCPHCRCANPERASSCENCGLRLIGVTESGIHVPLPGSDDGAHRHADQAATGFPTAGGPVGKQVRGHDTGATGDLGAANAAATAVDVT